MIPKGSLKQTLEALNAVLQLENKALIENDLPKIEEIVSEKLELARKIEEVEDFELNEENQEIRSLVKDIKQMQETNMMLTKQAMNYTDTFINAFQNEAKKDVTYSKKGNQKNKSSSGLLNRSL